MTYNPGGYQGQNEPYDDPFQVAPPPKKSPWPMISALAVVVALVAAGVIYTVYFKDSSSISAQSTSSQSASAQPGDQETAAATVIETVTPTEEDKDESKDKEDKDKDRGKEDKDDPALTRSPDAPAGGLNKEHNRLTPPDRVRHQELPPTPVPTTPWVDQKVAHVIALDYRSGWPESISEYHVSKMFDISPSDEDFEKRFNQLNPEELSKPLLQEGFKPWWPADGPAHTDKFLELQNQPRASIFTQRELLDSYRIANDVMVYHWRVEPQVSGGINDGEELPPFEVKVAMIGTQDGLWLLDDYWFPEGKEPSIH